VKYRSRTDIAAAMLEIALEGAIKTKIMYKAFLSFPQLKEYLAVLEEKGLLEYISTDHEYRTTDKGKHFLKMYRDVGQMVFPDPTGKKK
jgi:predicted transcriptional regulator